MAFYYDQMGNITGEYETEEERKRREEAMNSEVQKQEIKTYGDGSQTQTLTTEIPAPIQPTTMPVEQPSIQPIPTNISPVQPNPTYQRMLQMESGNRDYTMQGTPVTSPAGAMFASQVMPATAQQPGFGIQPAQSQTPEEYNRVGREYFDAMLKRYGGNNELAAAAYHSGPGNVDKALQQAQSTGNDWRSFLGPQGQKYVQGVQGVQNAPQPNIQPAVATMPSMQPAGQGLKVAGMQEQPMALGTAQYISQYQSMQDDPNKLLSISQDKNAPEWLRERSRYRAADLIAMERDKKRASDELRAMDENQLANVLRQKTTGGSWLKAGIFSLLGMDQSAAQEAAKLGIGKETVMLGEDGTPYMIKVSSNGTPIEGYNAKTGSKLSSQELISASAGAGTKLNIVGGSYVNDKTGEVGRLVTDEKTGRSYVQTDTGRKPMTGFRPQSSMGTLGDMRTRQVQEINLKLQGKGVEEQMAILRDYNKGLVSQGYQAVQPSEVGINVPQIGGGQAQPSMAPQMQPQAQPSMAPQAQMQPAPVAPTPIAPSMPSMPPGQAVQPSVPGQGLGGRPTGSQLEATKTLEKEAAQEVGTDIGKLKVNQSKSEQNADYLITKMNELVNHPGFSFSVGVANVGPVPLPGAGKLAGMIEGTDTSDWAARFNEVKGQSFLQAVENMRGMGALSNQEGDAATKAIQRMSTSQSETEFKAAAKDFEDIIKRGIDRNREKLGQQPKYGTLMASETTKPTTSEKTINGVTYVFDGKGWKKK